MIRSAACSAFALLVAFSAAAQDQPASLDAVMAAIQSNDVGAVARLLDENPSLVDDRNGRGLSPLSLAAYLERSELVDIVRDRRGTPDFFEACILGDEAAVQAALEAGQDVDALAPDGFTPLGLAVFFGHPELARLLLDAGADPSLQAANGQRSGPIHAAVTRGDLATLELLLLKGADANAAQQGGLRPIHEAAASGNLSVVALVLLFGADPSAKTDDGKTAADIAREKGNARLAELIDAL